MKGKNGKPFGLAASDAVAAVLEKLSAPRVSDSENAKGLVLEGGVVGPGGLPLPAVSAVSDPVALIAPGSRDIGGEIVARLCNDEN